MNRENKYMISESVNRLNTAVDILNVVVSDIDAVGSLVASDPSSKPFDKEVVDNLLRIDDAILSISKRLVMLSTNLIKLSKA